MSTTIYFTSFQIPATYSGILASRTLESLPGRQRIHTNLTLVFTCTQAIAGAQAGATMISPFVGRVKDWWEAHPEELPICSSSLSLSKHPGIALIQQIREAYNIFGYSRTTQVMACGFRAVEEVMEVAEHGPGGGVDLFTLQPALLQDLRSRAALAIQSTPPPFIPSSTPPVYVRDPNNRSARTRAGARLVAASDEAQFNRDLKRDKVALDKVPEGLEKFSKDTRALEHILRGRIERARERVGHIRSDARL